MEPIGIDNTIPKYEDGVPPRSEDKRTSKQQKIALYAMLTCTLFERAAYYALVTNLVANLNSMDYLNWTSEHSALALFIFSGQYYFCEHILKPELIPYRYILYFFIGFCFHK